MQTHLQGCLNMREGPEYLFRGKSISQTTESSSYSVGEDASVLLACSLPLAWEIFYAYDILLQQHQSEVWKLKTFITQVEQGTTETPSVTNQSLTITSQWPYSSTAILLYFIVEKLESMLFSGDVR